MSIYTLFLRSILKPRLHVGEDLAINLWDLGSGKRIKKMTGHTASIYSLAFSAESSLLVSGGADWTVRCWDVKGAGGSRSKPRENGSTYNLTGLAGNKLTPNRGSVEEESIETYVQLWLILWWCVQHSNIHLFSTDLLATFPTKRTSITNVQFTSRNLCLVGGAYLSAENR